MREPVPPPPPMSQAPAYSSAHKSPYQQAALYKYTQPLRSPPAAHIEAKQSVSSATSGTTDVTDPTANSAGQGYHGGPHVERSLAQSHLQSRPQYMSPTTSSRLSASQPRTREMVQAPPATVIRYIQHDVDEDDEEEPDHAIWILVR
jgi:hypothetical protein